MHVCKVPNTTDPTKPLRASIFLAGCCPRDSGVPDWRVECCELFAKHGFDGSLFWPVPEDNSDIAQGTFDLNKQVAWETKHLKMADVILFWIPRDMSPGSAMLGMTSNVEFGLYINKPCVLGYPPSAERMRYLSWWAKRSNIPVTNTLESTVLKCIEMLRGWGWRPSTARAEETAAGAATSTTTTTVPALPRRDILARYHGEQYIPLNLWRARCFTDWYSAQRKQGNELVFAEVEWALTIPNKKTQKAAAAPAFIAVLKAHVKIASENGRIKDNEVVIFRPDTAVVITYFVPSDAKSLTDVQVLLTKEFRTPARNDVGAVVEPAAGSSWDEVEYSPRFASEAAASAEELAAQDKADRSKRLARMALEELHEETGLEQVPAERIVYHASRQLSGTLSAHHAHVFSCKLTEHEFAVCQKAVREATVFGVAEDTERTTLLIASYGDVVSGKVHGIDWSAVGMITQALFEAGLMF